MSTSTFVENVRKKLAAKTPPKSDKKRTRKNKKKATSESSIIVPGTIYIGHIPHGFYEEQMQQYFSQFGKVLRLRLARSRKTGKSKGYAFVEFENEEVAKVVAGCMNNYLFFEKLLKCEFLPAEKLNGRNVFNGWKSKDVVTSDKNRLINNKIKSEESLEKSKAKRVARLKKLKAGLKEKGITFPVKSFYDKTEK